jgi:hypothetical protein
LILQVEFQPEKELKAGSSFNKKILRESHLGQSQDAEADLIQLK